MGFSSIPAGHAFPDDFNVIVEIPAQGGDIKYEVDKETGLLAVDRFMSVAMHYPCNYGYVPSTLAEDGDPMDVLVITPTPMMPGSIIRARAVGILEMTDEAGKDSKVLALPIAKVCSAYAHMSCLEDVPQDLRDKIAHFFESYKALEPNKWVKVDGWQSAEHARAALQESLQRYASHQP